MDVSCVNFLTGMVVYIKFLETSFPNLQNVRIRKTLACTSYLVKMKVILTRSMLVKPKKCSQHLKEDYWNDCIAVISKDNLLNKAHVKYLENKFYNIALSTGRANMLNSTIPTCSSISEYDEAMLSEFISNTKLLVNTLGYKTFDSIEDSSIKAGPKQLLFYIDGARGASSKGVIVPDGFAVFKDSKIASSTVPSMSAPLIKLRTSLIEKGVIDSNFCFTKDYIFTSPSLAAAIVMGRNANGRTEWKTEDHKSIKDIEEKL